MGRRRTSGGRQTARESEVWQPSGSVVASSVPSVAQDSLPVAQLNYFVLSSQLSIFGA